MILEQLGLLLENESLTTDDSDTPAAIGYCLDLVSAKNDPGVGGGPLYLTIKCTVDADYGSSNETYQFILRNGNSSDGTDIDATLGLGGGARDVFLTEEMGGNDLRLDAGEWIARVSLPMDIEYRYLQMFKVFGGTTPAISVSVTISPTVPPSDRNRQVGPLPPAEPLGQTL